MSLKSALVNNEELDQAHEEILNHEELDQAHQEILNSDPTITTTIKSGETSIASNPAPHLAKLKWSALVPTLLIYSLTYFYPGLSDTYLPLEMEQRGLSSLFYFLHFRLNVGMSNDNFCRRFSPHTFRSE